MTTYVCDDCYKPYEGPVYYTFDRARCVSTLSSPDPTWPDYTQMGERIEPFWPDEFSVEHGSDCTGNLCPSCAGPYLDPDDPFDDRRPIEAPILR
jgi:hypothetical protein